MSEPSAVYSIPVEDGLSPDDPQYLEAYGGQTVYRIGVPYITDAG